MFGWCGFDVRMEWEKVVEILLERKQALIFVYKVHCRDLLLHDVPRKRCWITPFRHEYPQQQTSTHDH